MPVDVLTLPLSSMNTKWKEPYASASLNAKLTGIIAPGIYRGLIMAPDPLLGDRTVLVKADVETGDHVAVYQNALGYSVTYRDSTSGDITLSLSSYSNVTVIVCVYIDYTPGVDTTGSFRIFTQAEFNVLSAGVRNALVILGTVTVPVSGPISSGSITLLNRTLASNNLPSGAIPNAPVVRNPGFELGETNGTYAKSSVFWDKSFTVGSGTWKTSTAIVNTGLKSIEMNITSGPVTGELSQQMGIETAEGELFLVNVSVQQMKTVSSGSIVVFLDWADATDAILTTTTVSLDGGGIDSSFRSVRTIVAAPAGVVSLRAVGVRASVLSPASTGTFMYIDNVDVFIQPRNSSYPYPFDQSFRRPVATTRIALEDPTANFAGLAASLRQDVSTPASEGRVLLEPNNPSNLPPAFGLLGRIFQLGASLLGSESNSLKPRVSADISTVGGVDFTLMWESGRNGETTGTYTQPVVRIYGSNDGQWVLTSNAIWGGTTWTKDVAAQNATKIGLAKDGLRVFTRVSDIAWSDTAWADTIRVTNPLETAADARTARVSGGLWNGGPTNNTDFTLISQWKFTSAGAGVRVYAAIGGAPLQSAEPYSGSINLYFVVNASWDGTNWNKDVSGTVATRVHLFTPQTTSDFFPTTRYEYVPQTTADAFSESGWSAPNGASGGGLLWAGRLAAGPQDSTTGSQGAPADVDAIISAFPDLKDTILGSPVMPSADLFSTGLTSGTGTPSNFRLDSIGVYSPAGAIIFEEFQTGGIPPGFSNVIGGSGTITYNINGKTRVQFAGAGGGSAGIVSNVSWVGCSYAVVNFWIRFDDVLGASFFGLVDGSGNQQFGFVQDSVTYGDENIRVVCRTGSGLQALDTGVSATNSAYWYNCTAYCWGGVGAQASNTRVFWRIGYKKTDGSGVWNPGGPVLSGDTARFVKILIGPSALVSVERFTIYGRNEHGA